MTEKNDFESEDNSIDREDLVAIINAMDRNTAATRSIAMFLFGSFPYILGGLGLAAVPFVIMEPGAFPAFALMGAALVLFGTIRSVVMAFKELRYSDFKF